MGSRRLSLLGTIVLVLVPTGCKNDCEKAVALLDSCFDSYCSEHAEGGSCDDQLRESLHDQLAAGFGDCGEDGAEAAEEILAGGCDQLNPIFALTNAFHTPGEDPNVTIRVGEPTANAIDIGGRQVSAQECEIDGGLLGHWSNLSTSPLQIAPDGTFYILHGDGAVRAYDTVPGATCGLQIRSSFGENGVLRLEDEINSLSVDQNSVLHLGTRGHTIQIVGGESGASCTLPGHVRWHFAAAPDGTWGITVAQARRATFGSPDCEVESPSALAAFRDQVSAVTITSDRIWVGVQAHSDADPLPKQVVGYDHQNNELVRFGGSEPLADDGFGTIDLIAPCGDNLCVVEKAFGEVNVWSTEGELIGVIDVVDLVGIRRVSPHGFATAPDGANYLLLWEQGGENVGHLFRVAGL